MLDQFVVFRFAAYQNFYYLATCLIWLFVGFVRMNLSCLALPMCARLKCWTWSGFRIAIQPDSALQNRIQIGLDFEKISTGSDMDIQTALITAVKCLIRVFLGYKPDWINYLDRSTRLGSDRITQRKFWTGLGFQKFPIFSTLLDCHTSVFLALIYVLYIAVSAARKVCS